MIDTSAGHSISNAIKALERLAETAPTRVPGRFDSCDKESLLGVVAGLKAELGKTPQSRTIIPLRHRVAWEVNDISDLLENPTADIVMARRHSGKTWSLLFHILKHKGHRAIVVCPSRQHAEYVKAVALEVFDLEDVRAALTKIGRPSIPAIMAIGQFLSYIRGHERVPTYVDEWNLFSLEDQLEIAKSGWFEKAVTS